MPRPPPPAAALTSSGNPTARAASNDGFGVGGPRDRRRLEGPGNDGHAGVAGEATSRELVSQRGNDVALRATNTSPASSTALAKRGSLGQKAIARVDGFGPRGARGLDESHRRE